LRIAGFVKVLPEGSVAMRNLAGIGDDGFVVIDGGNVSGIGGAHVADEKGHGYV
jgi:hypothetical protein